MLSSLLRPRKARYNHILQGSSSPFADADASTPMLGQRDKVRHAVVDWTETEDNEDYTLDDDEDYEDYEDDDEPDEENDLDNPNVDHGEERDSDHDGNDHEDGGEGLPLLPIFSATHLGMEYT